MIEAKYENRSGQMRSLVTWRRLPISREPGRISRTVGVKQTQYGVIRLHIRLSYMYVPISCRVFQEGEARLDLFQVFPKWMV